MMSMSPTFCDPSNGLPGDLRLHSSPSNWVCQKVQSGCRAPAKPRGKVLDTLGPFLEASRLFGLNSCKLGTKELIIRKVAPFEDQTTH